MDVGPIYILVVDDEADMANSMVELLSLWSYEAVACYRGATAIQSACVRRPDAVLLDLAMPGMSGFQFAELFRQLPGCRLVPLIAMSGYASLAYQTKAREVGISHYLLKPSDPKQLRDLLVWEVEALAIRVPMFDQTDDSCSDERHEGHPFCERNRGELRGRLRA